jgi:hypothetical protein
VDSVRPRPVGASARGYNFPGQIPLRSRTSGVRAEGRPKPVKTSSGHTFTGKPVNVSEGSRMVMTEDLHSEPVITFHIVHMDCHVMEELGSMCDGGDCWI